MKKAHINSLRNLLTHYNREEILSNIDQINVVKQDREDYNTIFATDESAVAWFIKFCESHNLTATRVMRMNKKLGKEVPYGRYVIKEMRSSQKPYITLWIKDGHQNDDQTPHIELGSSLFDMWFATGLSDLEAKMNKLVRISKES